mmetsp:Transcript_23762/g.23459  ORF Transcript_23762/g.23459 Transcript_23762/m.23459 type:complete len:135 (+) Transcript_23762:390-794(+)
MYAGKCVMKDRPYSFLLVAIMVPIFIGGFSLRIFERHLMEISGRDFDSLVNNLWCIFITMMTVGYGYYTPVSNMGRIIGIISCLWGVFIVSVFVLTLNNLLEFSIGELKSFDILSKLQAKENLQLKAIAVLKSA